MSVSVSVLWRDPDVDYLPPDLSCNVSLYGTRWFVVADCPDDPMLAGRVLLVFGVRNFRVLHPTKAILGDGSVALKTCLRDVLDALKAPEFMACSGWVMW